MASVKGLYFILLKLLFSYIEKWNSWTGIRLFLYRYWHCHYWKKRFFFLRSILIDNGDNFLHFYSSLLTIREIHVFKRDVKKISLVIYKRYELHCRAVIIAEPVNNDFCCCNVRYLDTNMNQNEVNILLFKEQQNFFR